MKVIRAPQAEKGPALFPVNADGRPIAPSLSEAPTAGSPSWLIEDIINGTSHPKRTKTIERSEYQTPEE